MLWFIAGLVIGVVAAIPLTNAAKAAWAWIQTKLPR